MHPICRSRSPSVDICLWLSLLFVVQWADAGLHRREYETDDAVVIEAPTSDRKQRSILYTQSLIHPLILGTWEPDFNHRQGGIWANNLVALGPCFTSKGTLGQCTSFRQCYPYFKLPELSNWETWILGMYDTCSYFTPQGRQMFGVCCTNPVTQKPETTTSEMTLETEDDRKEERLEITTTEILPENNNTEVKRPQVGARPISNWPPPIPTHPPDHTIPPLPTHPPSPGFPALPTHPTSLPVSTTTFPTNRPSVRPTIRSTNRPTPTTQAAPSSNLGCGAKNGYQDQERIVGGHNADLGEWPWIAALFNGGRQFCGGSLIDNIHILSAAHCVAHMTSWDVARLTVRLGDHNIKTNSEVRHLEKRVKRVVRHRGFDSRTLYNDVAVLTLDAPVQFNHQIRPICLPTASSSQYTGQTATVIGWGSLRESGPQPAILQEVNIPIWSNSECRLKYGNAAPGGIVDHMLCAGQASRDSCSGDSGGPLMVNTGRWTQVGIVSWGIGCGKGQYPGVYTRVTNFLPWIQKNLK